MSADESGNRPSTRPLASAPPASSGPPSSSGFPADALVAWGQVRDAITSVHNLEALLRSPRIAGKALGEVLPEFHGGVDVLRGAFAASVTGTTDPALRVARELLARTTTARLDELELGMRAAARSDLDARGRLALEQVVMRVSVDLDAAAELLDLSERASRAVAIDLSIEELAHASLRGGASRGRITREVGVRFATGDARDCALHVDPHVLKRLIVFAVARVAAMTPGATGVTIRAACDASNARFAIAATTDAEAKLAPTPLRLVRRLDATDAVVDASAAAAGIASTFESGVLTMRVPRATA